MNWDEERLTEFLLELCALFSVGFYSGSSCLFKVLTRVLFSDGNKLQRQNSPDENLMKETA
jgi:hypothetical protein